MHSIEHTSSRTGNAASPLRVAGADGLSRARQVLTASNQTMQRLMISGSLPSIVRAIASSRRPIMLRKP